MKIGAQVRAVERQHGFTITEILIVVAVIGILVSIVAVLYPGYQKRVRDSERKSDLSQLAATFGAYAQQKNNYIATASGCGSGGDGNGWLNARQADNNTYAVKSISDCLQDAGLLPNGEIIDPLGCRVPGSSTCGTGGSSAVKAYMKATCTKGGATTTYLFATLENEPRKDAEVDAVCDVGSVWGFDANSQKWGSLYGMNYYVAAR